MMGIFSRKERATCSCDSHDHCHKYDCDLVKEALRDIGASSVADTIEEMASTPEPLHGIGVHRAAAMEYITRTEKVGSATIFHDTPVSKETLTVSTFDEWALIESVLPHAPKVLLYGPPGTGKTHIATTALRDEQGVFSVTMTEETPAETLRGHFIPTGNAMRWMDGPGIAAWRKGHRLVINEIDHALGDALDFLHVLCDDPTIAQVTLPKEDQETVHPQPGFQVVATMNGDPSELPEALRDRFPVKIHVKTIAPAALATLSPDLRDPCRDTSMSVVEGSERLSIRAWKEFDSLRFVIGPENAANAVFGSRAQEIHHALAVRGMPGGVA